MSATQHTVVTTFKVFISSFPSFGPGPSGPLLVSVWCEPDRPRLDDQTRSSCQAKAAYIAPEADSLQQPYADHDNYDDVQNRFDAGGHGYEPVDQEQPDPDDDQKDNNI
jgi:hypothetical protein